MKTVKKHLVRLAAFALFALMAICVPDTARPEQAAVPDPFEAPVQQSIPNCDKEYRFKYDIEIKNTDEFIGFLQKHQGGFLDSYKPDREQLIPLHMYDSVGKKMLIDLDAVKGFVKVMQVQKSILSNTTVYKLDIMYNDYDRDSWPWKITVLMSDKGCVSVISCAGI